MILLLDNYDSFTYNLFQYITELGEDVKVIRNDELDIKQLKSLNPEKLVISPGPSKPDNAGISNKAIREFSDKIPILGVCLGHQCIGQTFGAKVQYAGEVKHGKTSLIHHDHSGLFFDVPSPFQAARYHSLSLASVPIEFHKTAWTNDGEIMGIQHESLPLFGVQFHPESFLTPMGSNILENFLNV